MPGWRAPRECECEWELGLKRWWGRRGSGFRIIIAFHFLRLRHNANPPSSLDFLPRLNRVPVQRRPGRVGMMLIACFQPLLLFVVEESARRNNEIMRGQGSNLASLLQIVAHSRVSCVEGSSDSLFASPARHTWRTTGDQPTVHGVQ